MYGGCITDEGLKFMEAENKKNDLNIKTIIIYIETGVTAFQGGKEELINMVERLTPGFQNSLAKELFLFLALKLSPDEEAGVQQRARVDEMFSHCSNEGSIKIGKGWAKKALERGLRCLEETPKIKDKEEDEPEFIGLGCNIL